ncbi:MAG: flagellar basal-body rod protein FlgF [FCB group bacterium]|jgi:flagellar basal-body rod protein FlgG|nr:flagellar basal-body rod protein FlgF [FCB group bacterium]
MIQGLYAAASGMIAIEDQQSIIANNIANASTPGFKRQNCVEEGFYSVFSEKMRSAASFGQSTSPGGGVRIVGSYADWREGTLATTDDPFSIALTGPGFLTVQTDNGDRYTRGGRLQIDPEGHLATADGKKVMGAGSAPITVTGNNFQVDEDGNVYSDGANVGRMQLMEFDDPRLLTRDGDGLYATGDSGPQAVEATETSVHGGMLELSNVQLPYEMAQMISGIRAYGAYQKVINTSDESIGRLIDQVAMPA